MENLKQQQCLCLINMPFCCCYLVSVIVDSRHELLERVLSNQADAVSQVPGRSVLESQVLTLRA